MFSTDIYQNTAQRNNNPQTTQFILVFKYHTILHLKLKLQQTRQQNNNIHCFKLIQLSKHCAKKNNQPAINYSKPTKRITLITIIQTIIPNKSQDTITRLLPSTLDVFLRLWRPNDQAAVGGMASNYRDCTPRALCREGSSS